MTYGAKIHVRSTQPIVITYFSYQKFIRNAKYKQSFFKKMREKKKTNLKMLNNNEHETLCVHGDVN